MKDLFTLFEAPTRIGRYDIEGLLGEGGMAKVYRSRDPVIERVVALKSVDKRQIRSEEASMLLSRFKREAQAAGRLVHPNIVSIFEYGEDDFYAYIAMECVFGKSLQAFSREDFRTELRHIRTIISQILQALDHSHREGVIHRDMKPSNILVSRDGIIKVTDFGIARLESSSLTQYGVIMGTPNYMSPEQFMGQDADARTDLYSTGVMLYELLTHSRLFTGANNAAIMGQVINSAPSDPSLANDLVPPQLDWVVHKAIAKQPEDRFQTAQEFLRALQDAIPDHASGSPAASNLTPARKPADVIPTPQLGLLNAARMISAARGNTIHPEAAPPATSQSLPRPAAAVDSGKYKPRILFVDDEERILTALRSIFRSRYDVHIASNGEQALELARQYPFPLIVSDQRMPLMTGVEVLRQVREFSPNTVRILLTGYSDLAAIVGSINEGEVFRFVSKPWNNQELQQIIGEAMDIGLRTASTVAPNASVLPRMQESVLIVERDASTLEMVRDLVGRACPVQYTRSIDEALHCMVRSDIAVIIADVDDAPDEYVVFLNLLKLNHPQIICLALARHSDSEHVIALINDAQVFRFVSKPVAAEPFQAHLRAALLRYAATRATPEILEHNRVHVTEKSTRSPLASAILSTLKAITPSRLRM
jgi:eukaryotic-like serine/threonine-protein kinase